MVAIRRPGWPGGSKLNPGSSTPTPTPTPTQTPTLTPTPTPTPTLTPTPTPTRWEQHGLVAVGIRSAPEADGTGAGTGAGTGPGTGADARRSSPQASRNSPLVPDKEELNRRGWDLLKHAEGWMLDPPKMHPPQLRSGSILGSISEAPLPGFDAEAHGMRVHLEVQQMVLLLVTDGAGRDAYAGSTLIAEVHLEPSSGSLTLTLSPSLSLSLTPHPSPLSLSLSLSLTSQPQPQPQPQPHPSP